MSTTTPRIDFTKIQGPVYSGRDRGERLRVELDLDGLDASSEPVKVEIPEGTYTISSSFFLGLFGPSVAKAGSKDAFYSHYQFTTPSFLKDVLDGYVSRALQRRSLFS